MQTKRQINGLANLALKELSIDAGIPLKSGQTIDLTKFTTSASAAVGEIRSDGRNYYQQSN